MRRAVEAMELFTGRLQDLRAFADDHAGDVRSPGLTAFFRMLAGELDDAYLAAVDDHLRRLRFKGGVLVSAELGQGCKGTGHVLRRPHPARGWRDKLTGDRPPSHTYRVPDRDEAGAKALAELRNRGLNLAADALARPSDHILGFFTMLRRELGFYLGCLHLHEALAARGGPLCLPTPRPAGRPDWACRGLYDPCLSLRRDEAVVGNDVAADGASLIVVTGANGGGKSTFLRSAGVAQLMMQAGMFAAASSFTADVRDAVFTHFRREEDAGMDSGKLDEELSRMSTVPDRLTPGGMVLFNESFAATNEREGSEIARQVVGALRDCGVKVFTVTHLYDFAHTLHTLHTRHPHGTVFLRAQRWPDGTPTFRLEPGEPLPTSFGEDLYRDVFGAADEPAPDRDERPRPGPRPPARAGGCGCGQPVRSTPDDG